MPHSIIKKHHLVHGRKFSAGRVKHQVMNPKDMTANTAYFFLFTERYLLNMRVVNLNESNIEPIKTANYGYEKLIGSL